MIVLRLASLMCLALTTQTLPVTDTHKTKVNDVEQKLNTFLMTGDESGLNTLFTMWARPSKDAKIDAYWHCEDGQAWQDTANFGKLRETRLFEKLKEMNVRNVVRSWKPDNYWTINFEGFHPQDRSNTSWVQTKWALLPKNGEKIQHCEALVGVRKYVDNYPDVVAIGLTCPCKK